MININNYFLKDKKLKPLIIAEISANHCGKKSLFLKTIKAAAANGADLIKIQTYEPRDITVNRNFKIQGEIINTWKLYKEAQTPFKWHEDAFRLAKKLKIQLFSTPFSIRAVNFLKKFKVKLFKISSFEITDTNLILKIARTKKPIIISTGMASIEDIKKCIKVINRYHNKIILLHCVSGYPTNENQANLNRIKNLKKLFPQYNIGLSDHTNDILTSLSSIPIGVKIIEKHFIYNKKIKSLDSKFSIDPKKLNELKLKSTRVFDSLGNGKFELQAPEKKSISYKRSIFSIRKIEKNEKFSKNNISTFRPLVGIPANKYFDILGKKAKKKINAFSPIFKSHLK